MIQIESVENVGRTPPAPVWAWNGSFPDFPGAGDSPRGQLALAVRHIASLHDALDWVGEGLAIVEADGRVVYANRAMLEICGQGDGVRIIGGVLVFDARDAAEQVRRSLELVASAPSTPALPSPQAFLAPRPSGGPALLAVIRPDRAAGPEPGGRHRAVVFLRDPSRRDDGEPLDLRPMLELTPAEARLAEALLQGQFPVDYARQKGLSVNTIYTHLRRLKEKTGARRLAELIRLLDNLAPRVRRS